LQAVFGPQTAAASQVVEVLSCCVLLLLTVLLLLSELLLPVLLLDGGCMTLPLRLNVWQKYGSAQPSSRTPATLKQAHARLFGVMCTHVLLALR
jgi:hypothetical protein